MNFKRLKKEIFFLRKAFFEFGQGFKYVKNRFFTINKILKEKSLEKPVNNRDLSIHILTGNSDVKMMIWSLASFYRNFNQIGQLYIHSDGTVSEGNKKVIKNYFPGADIIDSNYFVKDYGQDLSDWPVIKKFREMPQYFLMKKLIDPYFVSDKKYRLIIDTDLIWYRQAKEVEEEIENGCQKSLVMKNSSPVYVDFKQGRLSDELALVNTGVVLYKKESFNFDKLTDYLNKLDGSSPKNRHFIEQAGYASCLENLEILPDNRYIIKGKIEEDVAMKHYTSPRRPLFYTEGLDIIKKYF